MFLGFHKVNLDAKGRMAIPARYRDRLKETCGSRLVVTVHPRERCLWLYPMTDWEPIAAMVAKISPLKDEGQVLRRLLLGQAMELDLDSAGRVNLPQYLLDYAGLSKGLVLQGQGNKFEIWDAAHYGPELEGWREAAVTPMSEVSEELENLPL